LFRLCLKRVLAPSFKALFVLKTRKDCNQRPIVIKRLQPGVAQP
jgi:hypothetical protein